MNFVESELLEESINKLTMTIVQTPVTSQSTTPEPGQTSNIKQDQINEPSQHNVGSFMLNHPVKPSTVIEGQEQPIPSTTPPPQHSSCLWAGNVCPTVTREALQTLFSSFGSVSLIRHFPNSNCAFITFDRVEDAESALTLEGTQLGSMRLTLNLGQSSRHLWLGNVGPSVTEQMLRAAFQTYGQLESVRILRQNQCAFVNFVNDECAAQAMHNLNGAELGGKPLVVNYQWKNKSSNSTPASTPPQRSRKTSSATGTPFSVDKNLLNMPNGMYQQKLRSPKRMPTFEQEFTVGYNPYKSAQRPASRQLFVGNLSARITEEMLYDIFSPYGAIESVRYFQERGYAFVTYQSIQVAAWVKQQLTQTPVTLDQRLLKVDFGREVIEGVGTSQDYMTDQDYMSMADSSTEYSASPEMSGAVTPYSPGSSASSPYGASMLPFSPVPFPYQLPVSMPALLANQSNGLVDYNTFYQQYLMLQMMNLQQQQLHVVQPSVATTSPLTGTTLNWPLTAAAPTPFVGATVHEQQLAALLQSAQQQATTAELAAAHSS